MIAATSFDDKEAPMQPYCCPVCQGRGLKPYSFYSPPTPGTSFGAITCDVACRSCSGTGIVWRGEDDAEGQPAKIDPPRPLTPSSNVTVTTTGNFAAYHDGTLSFTAIQGPIPATRRESSVDKAYLHGGY
jgi:hypothetical protein